MMDKAVYRQIISILEEMRQTMSKEASRKDLRPPGEYITAFRQMEEVCRRDLSRKRQKEYLELLEPLRKEMGRLARKEKSPGRKQLHSIDCLVEKLLMGFREEKELKKDIVFLPYSASMWDCMESVWKAARKDAERCSTYVIPIPYCDRNSEGNPIAWHCDAENFPEEVPVVDWRSVDLRAMHPDIIIIHNPHEDNNFVTSVESRYFPSRLKECTDKLVYIPYFILPEHPVNRERTSIFAGVPALLHADVTILQSDIIRDEYIRALTEDHQLENRAYWEKRIVGLGSPKIDKVLNSKKEDFSLPEEWQKKVRGKKIILYNTSLSDVVNLTELFPGKLRDTFRVFRESEKVVLWWRPHPLLGATIQRLCPEILEEYQKLLKAYQEEGWGIYDSTGDLHRAIAWSDAFYGDGSSVALLYRKTGKPVLIQDYHMRCSA